MVPPTREHDHTYRGLPGAPCRPVKCPGGDVGGSPRSAGTPTEKCMPRGLGRARRIGAVPGEFGPFAVVFCGFLWVLGAPEFQIWDLPKDAFRNA